LAVVTKKRKEREEKKALLEERKAKRQKRENKTIKFLDLERKGRGWRLLVCVNEGKPEWVLKSSLPKHFNSAADHFVATNEAGLVEDPEELYAVENGYSQNKDSDSDSDSDSD